MSKNTFIKLLSDEVTRIDKTQTSKRHERVIDGFTNHPSPRAIMKEREYTLFNSNDYLGLRHHPRLKQAEHDASERFGAGPGAVRFISGSLKVHQDLERALARFHGRDATMLFSSAFAANLAVLFSFLKRQSKDSLVADNTVVVSDALNHRSIIDGIRLANLDAEHKRIFNHLDMKAFDAVLASCVGKYERAVVVTDGVFSMLGEIQNLHAMRSVIDAYDDSFPHGVWLIVDDCHGVAACGATGRGAEELTGGRADILIGTLGKGFGADGGYVVADAVIIDYLRESSATYIYSNPVSPATAAAGLAGVQVVDSEQGQALLAQSQSNIAYFKEEAASRSIPFVADSNHPIQPVLIGDPQTARTVTQGLFEAGIMVTSINYPVVPRGKDEIRVQISATHTHEDITSFLSILTRLIA